MQYTMRTISETRRGCSITASASEARSFMDTALRGRKKEAPKDFSLEAASADNPFFKEVSQKAMQLLTSAFIRQALEKEGLHPVARPALRSSSSLEYGREFTFDIEVDVLPAISFPADFSQLTIEVREPDSPPHKFYEATERLMRPLIRLEEVTEQRHAKPGDVAEISVEAEADGIHVPGLSMPKVRLALNAVPGDGPMQAVEEIARTLLPGETGTGEMDCPADFPWAALRGKKIRLCVAMHRLLRRNVPALDDETAKKLGFEDARILKSQAYMETMNRCILQRKQEAVEKLMAMLPGIAGIPVPESLTQAFFAENMQDLARFLRQDGKLTEEQVKAAMEASREQALKAAEETARRHTYLLAYAYSHGIAVSEKDLEDKLRDIARGSRRPLEETKKYFEESGMLDTLEERMMADKAMEKIYAQVKKVVVDAHGAPVPPPQAQ